MQPISPTHWRQMSSLRMYLAFSALLATSLLIVLSSCSEQQGIFGVRSSRSIPSHSSSVYASFLCLGNVSQHQIWVPSHFTIEVKSESVQITWKASDDILQFTVEPFDLTQEDPFTVNGSLGRVLIEGLTPLTRYRIIVGEKGSNWIPIEIARLRTLPPGNLLSIHIYIFGMPT